MSTGTKLGTLNRAATLLRANHPPPGRTLYNNHLFYQLGMFRSLLLKSPFVGLGLVMTMTCPEVSAQSRPCAGDAEPSLVLSASRDSRIMQTHRSMNDGAAGLVWLKRGPNVRGLVGFDLACLDFQTIECAELGVSVYGGYPRSGQAIFSAHHLHVDWAEGTQAFNPMSFQLPEGIEGPSPARLGPFPGTGPGTTWTCRIDASLEDSSTSECDAPDQWGGGDNCNGVSCYDPIASDNAAYVSTDQEELWWNVTSDVADASDQISWLLKVQNEEIKSGAVKFYTRDGARFRADHDPDNADAHLALAPRLAVYGEPAATPSVELVSPLVPVSNESITVVVSDAANPAIAPIEWRNTATGTSGTMTPTGDSWWTASVELNTGVNAIEFTLINQCTIEGTTTLTVTRSFNENCGNGVIDDLETCDDGNRDDGDCCSSACHAEPDDSPCKDDVLCTLNDFCRQGSCVSGTTAPLSCGNAHLCYTARRSRGQPKATPVRDLHVSDSVSDAEYDLRRTDSICSAAALDEASITDPQSHRLAYRARASKQVSTNSERFRVRDSISVIEVETRGVDTILTAASLALGTSPAPPGDGVADHYACHRIRVTNRNGFPSRYEARVDDQFEDRTYRLRRPARLCLAATIDGHPPVNPDLHVLCYDVRRSRGEAEHQSVRNLIETVDLFGTHGLDTKREERLCLPASVERLSGN